jgi:hypothetical protein
MPTVGQTAKSIAVLLGLFLLVPTAHAGPPLICHAFVIGAAPALPWAESQNWRAPRRDYDVDRLSTDLLALLSADAPVLARMENMRRATIYAAEDRRAAADLLAALLERAREPQRDAREAALRSFDAGYLIESYRQYNVALSQGMTGKARAGLPVDPDSDGYALVTAAAAALPEQAAEIEFAASLMTDDAATSERHRAIAAARAAPGSQLAINLEAWGS